MNTTAIQNWQEANQRYLRAALAVVREALECQVNSERAEEGGDKETRRQGDKGTRGQGDKGEDEGKLNKQQTTDSQFPLAILCNTFGLSPFERDVLLLCAGIELDSSFAPLCAAAQGEPRRTYPTFSLALSVFPESHWSAITPVSPLRRWRLIEVSTVDTLTLSPLRIDERVLHYLTGVSYLDDRLQGLIKLVPQGEWELPPSHQSLVHQIVELFKGEGLTRLAIQLCGNEPALKRAIAASACSALGLHLHSIRAADLPQSVTEREALARLWERESVLSNSALLLDCEALDSKDKEAAVLSFLESVGSSVILASSEPLGTRDSRPTLCLNVNKLSTSEQQRLWQSALGPLAQELNGQLEILVSQFNLSFSNIQAASTEVMKMGNGKDASPSPLLLLWDACRVQARTRLDDLAQRINPSASWDDLVLPEPQRQILRDMTAHVRQRFRVYETWGFASKSDRGLGISALFAGASGTGKTMAAEVLAHQLRLDLYRIDLSQVVSKYIGETEKNIKRVFDAAETGGAILLFDEADALFGKRSEVKDSHDRYANIEVSYLLQRIEAYQGLAILTTNLKNALDTAFLRRIRFIVQFPFPDAAQRAEIWQRIFPANTPTEGLDADKLARLNVTGGNIRNIALNAAFLAADAGEPVRMTHLLRAARSEYTKLEKSLTEAEIGGWV